jgi:hypothetical protein
MQRPSMIIMRPQISLLVMGLWLGMNGRANARFAIGTIMVIASQRRLEEPYFNIMIMRMLVATVEVVEVVVPSIS